MLTSGRGSNTRRSEVCCTRTRRKEHWTFELLLYSSSQPAKPQRTLRERKKKKKKIRGSSITCASAECECQIERKRQHRSARMLYCMRLTKVEACMLKNRHSNRHFDCVLGWPFDVQERPYHKLSFSQKTLTSQARVQPEHGIPRHHLTIINTFIRLDHHHEPIRVNRTGSSILCIPNRKFHQPRSPHSASRE